MGIFKSLFGKNKPGDDMKQQSHPDNGYNTTQSHETHKEVEAQAPVNKATIPWRTFSLFISSTFADMQAERDHLKNVVFPAVEEELHKRRIKLEIVDLRWGVDTTSMEQEDEREANVLKVCLDEIKRCRPFFIGLLGDRYGWVPSEQRMKDALVSEAHIIPEKGKSVTDLEIEFGVLVNREQLVRSAFYFRQPLPYDQFPAPRAALFSDQHNPFLSDSEKVDRKNALNKLKARINHHFESIHQPEKVKTYSLAWDAENEKVTTLEAFGKLVFDDILADCEAYAAETWDQVPQNWQEQELALLDAFTERNTDAFCGRTELLETIYQHLIANDNSNWGLILTGESGSGKSAVFSMISKRMHERNDCFVLAHSAGLSPRAKSVTSLLQIWNKQLSEYLGIKDDFIEKAFKTDDFIHRLDGEKVKETTTPIEKLQEKFLELIGSVSTQKRIALLIDALDRFEPTARAQHLSWLPTIMPANVRMLCTAISGTEKKALQYHKGLKVCNIDSFTTEEAKEMLLTLCKRQRKTLPVSIEKIILEKKRADNQPAISSPLWLSLAVNMLMTIDQDDFEKMSRLEGRGDQQIETYIGHLAMGFDPLPGKLFFSLVEKAGLVFDDEFIFTIFMFIACSRKGLRERDLAVFLPKLNILWDPLKFANICRWFKGYFVQQNDHKQWNLSHPVLINSIINHSPSEFIQNIHAYIAFYLMNLKDDNLKSTETMYHLLKGNEYEMAASFYSSDLLIEEVEGATSVFLDTLSYDSNNVDIISELPIGLKDSPQAFSVIVNRYVNFLDNYLEIEGFSVIRFLILGKLELEFAKLYMHDDYLDVIIGSYGPIVYKLGNLSLSLGNIELARGYYENFLKISEILNESFPAVKSIKLGLSISSVKLGDFHKMSGDFTTAFSFYEKCLILSRQLNDQFPSDIEMNLNLAISLSRLADLFQLKGEFKSAIEYYEKVVEIRQNISNLEQNNIENIIQFSSDLLSISKLHLEMGNLDYAQNYSIRSLNILEENYNANPNNLEIKSLLSSVFEIIGDVFQQMGKLNEAQNYFLDSANLIEALLMADSYNLKYKQNLSSIYQRIGTNYQLSDNLNFALSFFEKSLELSKILQENNPSHETYSINLSNSYRNIGNVYFLMDDMDRALIYYEKYSSIIINLCNENPNNEYLKDNLTVSLMKFGEIYKSKNNFVLALNYFEKSMGQLTILCEKNTENEGLKQNLCITYKSIGEIYEKLENIEEALIYYRNAIKLGEELCDANPKNLILRRNLFVILVKVAKIYKSRSDLEIAQDYYQKGIFVSHDLLEADYMSEKISKRVLSLYSDLGEIHYLKGNMNNALENFKFEFLLLEDLCNKIIQKPNLELFYALANSYYKIGSVLIALDLNQRAFENYEKAYHFFINKFNQTQIAEFMELADWCKKEKEKIPQTIKNEEENIILSNAIKYLQQGRDLLENNGSQSLSIEYFEKSIVLLKQISIESKNNLQYVSLLIMAYSKLAECCDDIQLKINYLETVISLLESVNSGIDIEGSSAALIANYSLLSFYYIIGCEFDKAVTIALKGIRMSDITNMTPEVSYLYISHVCALLFQGKYREAEQSYFYIKEKTFSDFTLEAFNKAFLEDLKTYEEEGITHPDVANIRELLNE